MKLCSTCKKEKELVHFHKDKKAKDGHCYSCKSCVLHRIKSNIDSLTPEERHLKYKRETARLLLRRKNNEIPDEIRIGMWANARRGSNNCLSRKSLDKEFLMKIGRHSKEFFDYLVFFDIRTEQSSLVAASLDRKDSSILYTEENCLVVPNWLNLAKGRGTYAKLFEYICHFLENENLHYL